MRLPKLPGFGPRTMKTALSVLLCLLFFRAITMLSYLLPESGSWIAQFLQFLLYRPNPIFACIAAVIAMQSTVGASLQLGGSRVIGTGVGAVLGLLFLWLDTSLLERHLNILLSAVGIVLVVNVCLLFKRPLSVSIGCVTFLIIMVTLEEQFPYLYAINRLIDTAIGISLSVAVNILVHRPNITVPEEHDDSNTTPT